MDILASRGVNCVHGIHIVYILLCTHARAHTHTHNIYIYIYIYI